MLLQEGQMSSGTLFDQKVRFEWNATPDPFSNVVYERELRLSKKEPWVYNNFILREGPRFITCTAKDLKEFALAKFLGVQ